MPEQTSSYDQLFSPAWSQAIAPEGALGAALQRLADDKKKAAMEAAAEILGDLYDGVVQMERDARAAEKQAREAREAATKAMRAFKFGTQTGNLFPIYSACFIREDARDYAARINVDFPGSKDSIWKVPADYVEPTDLPQADPSLLDNNNNNNEGGN